MKKGHYCKICGEYKANEKFSGKGHAVRAAGGVSQDIAPRVICPPALSKQDIILRHRKQVQRCGCVNPGMQRVDARELRQRVAEIDLYGVSASRLHICLRNFDHRTLQFVSGGARLYNSPSGLLLWQEPVSTGLSP